MEYLKSFCLRNVLKNICRRNIHFGIRIHMKSFGAEGSNGIVLNSFMTMSYIGKNCFYYLYLY